MLGVFTFSTIFDPPKEVIAFATSWTMKGCSTLVIATEGTEYHGAIEGRGWAVESGA